MQEIVFYKPSVNVAEVKSRMQQQSQSNFNLPEINNIEIIIPTIDAFFKCFTPKLVLSPKFQSKQDVIDKIYHYSKTWSRGECIAFCGDTFKLNDGYYEMDCKGLVDVNENGNIDFERTKKLIETQKQQLKDVEANISQNIAEEDKFKQVTMSTRLLSNINLIQRCIDEKTYILKIAKFKYTNTATKEYVENNIDNILENIKRSINVNYNFLKKDIFQLADISPYSVIDWQNIELLTDFKIDAVKSKIKNLVDIMRNNSPLFSIEKVKDADKKNYNALLYAQFKTIYDKNKYKTKTGFIDEIAILENNGSITWRIGNGQFSLFSLWKVNAIMEEWNMQELIKLIAEWNANGNILMQNLNAAYTTFLQK